jgi:hypothetical protein
VDTEPRGGDGEGKLTATLMRKKKKRDRLVGLHPSARKTIRILQRIRERWREVRVYIYKALIKAYRSWEMKRE